MLVDALAGLCRLRDTPYLVALNGHDALEIIRSNELSVVFLDIHMPVLDGLGVMRTIRAERLHVSVVLMSSDPDLVEHAGAWGLPSYLSKPFSIIEVLALIDRFSVA